MHWLTLILFLLGVLVGAVAVGLLLWWGMMYAVARALKW